MFTFCKERWARRGKKQKENHATKVTKIPKTKRQNYGMNKTIIYLLQWTDLTIFLFLFGFIGSWHWWWTVLCWFGQRWNLSNWRWQKSTSSWIHSWWTAYDCFGGKTKANETYSCQGSGPTYRYRMDQSGWHQKLFDFCHWSHAGRTRR